MKRLISICLVLAMVLTAIPFAFAGADDSDFEISGNKLVRYKGSSSSVTVPAEVEIIGSGAFMNNRTITSVRFAGRVTAIQSNAFAGCTKLARVSFADKSALESIGSYAFAGCLPMDPSWANGVKSVAGNAFDGCNISANKPAAPTNTPPVQQLPPTATPEPTATPDPTAVPTPAPTATPEPVVTPEPTEVPGTEATAEPVPEVPVVPTQAPVVNPTEAPAEDQAEEEPVNTQQPDVSEEPVRGEEGADDDEYVEEQPIVEEDTNIEMPIIDDSCELPIDDSAPVLFRYNRNTNIVITQQPRDFIGPVNTFATFPIVAEGNGLTYKWQYSADGTKWGGMSGSSTTTDTLSIKITEARNGNYYRCVITDADGNSIITDAAQIIVGVSEAISITTQPEDYVGPVGVFATYTVVAEGKDLTYKWQYSADGTTWGNMSGASTVTSTLQIKITEARDGNYYRCMVTDADGNVVYSEPAQMKIGQTDAIKITSQPSDVTGPIDSFAVFTVLAEGNGLSYKWQYSTNGTTWGNTSGASTVTNKLQLKITEARNGNYYRCQITDASGNAVFSNPVQLKVGTTNAIKITKQPTNVYGPLNFMASFSVVAEGEGLTYKWQYSNNGGASWGNMSGASTVTANLQIKITEARNGNYYRCQITDADGNVAFSEMAQMNLGVAPEGAKITQQPVNFEGQIGVMSSFHVVATGEGLTYKWQYSNNGGASWGNMSGTSTVTANLQIKITEARNGNLYRCVITDTYGNTVISDPAEMIALINEFTVDDIVYHIINDDTVEVIDYIGSATDLTVPATVKGFSVVRIDDGAFEGNATLKSIDLPDSILTIGSRAFANCPSLTDIR